jgi:glycosyltransferase involved in cell wall biosynthesis
MYCLSSVSGGALAYLRNMMPRLAERFAQHGEGHRLIFLAHEEQAPLIDGIKDTKVHWVRGERPRGYRRIWWERRMLPAILRAEKADVIFNPYQIGIQTLDRRQVLMVRNMEPFLFQAHRYSFSTELRNHLLRWYSIRSLRRADRVIAISRFVQDYLINAIGIDETRIPTIYHGCPDMGANADEARDRYLIGRLGVEHDYILTCGSLLPYRRCEDVIAAFNQCASALEPQMRLVIAGSGTDQRYGEMIRTAIAVSPFRDQIVFVGQVPWDTMAALYRRCKACVIATEIEACPNIAIEAMAAGCVIVSSDLPPLPEMFQGCSLEYGARDITQLAQQIWRSVEDDPLRRMMQAKARERAANFSWERCAMETYAALTEWPSSLD